MEISRESGAHATMRNRDRIRSKGGGATRVIMVQLIGSKAAREWVSRPGHFQPVITDVVVYLVNEMTYGLRYRPFLASLRYGESPGMHSNNSSVIPSMDNSFLYTAKEG